MKNYNLKESALHYYNIGLNITHIIPQRIINETSRYEFTLKEPSHRLISFKRKRQNIKKVLSFNWKEASGVGAVMGYKNIRSIDIDGCNDFKFIKKLLDNIGLPVDYEWVVRTGSRNGFQIIIIADNHPYDVPEGKVISLTPKRQYKSLFEHIELIWTNHVVLPPSKHVSGNKYEFISERMPIYLPRRVDKQLLLKFIERICKMHGDSETKGSYFENFMSVEYAFKQKILSYNSHLYKFYTPPFYFFIDIKTNELPNIYNQPTSDPETLPEIVQIATLVCDSLGKRVSHYDFLIAPEDWRVNKEVKDSLQLDEIKKRSISIRTKRQESYILNEETKEYKPSPVRTFFQSRHKLFYDQLSCLFGIFDTSYPVKWMIGYDLDYQLDCLKGLYLRNEKKVGYKDFNWLLRIMIVSKLNNNDSKICLKKSTKEFCGIIKKNENKYTELNDLYRKLFDEELVGANDAKNEVFSIAKCYWKLRDLGQINS